ncbi:MAG: hypothetical protein ABI876_16525, partial [Bacteroidota bacterium]
MEENSSETQPGIGGQTANPGYGLDQIAKAMTTAAQHDDPETRERAQRKVEKWVNVFEGMISGKLQVGGRTPVQGVPGWATLEVIGGGFATGELLAGGPLREHEHTMLSLLPPVPESDAREVLNRYWLGSAGMHRLLEMLRSGHYRVTVPEEGALLVMAWLVQNDRVTEALELLETIAPWFPTLRFYPVPADRPEKFDSLVFLQDVGTTVDALKSVRPDRRVLALRESVRIWAPFYDRMVELFMETVSGEPPGFSMQRDTNRHPLPDGRFPVVGGWPCAIYPEDWSARALALLAEYEDLRATHAISHRPDHKKRSFFQLRDYLRRCANDPASLSGRDVGRIRLILAGSISKRGLPGSSSLLELRGRQGREIRG